MDQEQEHPNRRKPSRPHVSLGFASHRRQHRRQLVNYGRFRHTCSLREMIKMSCQLPSLESRLDRLTVAKWISQSQFHGDLCFNLALAASQTVDCNDRFCDSCFFILLLSRTLFFTGTALVSLETVPMENNTSVKEADCTKVIDITKSVIIKNYLATRTKSKSLLIYESNPFCNQAVVKIRGGQGLHLWKNSIALMLHCQQLQVHQSNL